MTWPRVSASTQRWLVASFALPILLLNGWVLLQILNYFQSPIRIFVIANLAAFILGYPVRWLQRYPRLKLPYAVTIVLCTAALLLAAIALLIIPRLIDQLNQVFLLLPQLGHLGNQHLSKLDQLTGAWELPTNFRLWAKELSSQFPQQLQTITGQLLGLLIWTAGGLLEAGFILIMTIYLLLKGKIFWHGIFRWLPLPWRHPLRQTLRRSFQNYYIGQATVAALLGSSLIVAFTLFQVPLGLLFGLFVGVMAFFPFGGGASIVIISIIAALKSFWLGIKVLAIATVVDQIVENGLAPRLLGGFTGVHPVWILLSLIIGGKIAGILGILVAVPITSVVQDVINGMMVP
jgi:predicted PurR-regulated permease PerM